MVDVVVRDHRSGTARPDRARPGMVDLAVGDPRIVESSRLDGPAADAIDVEPFERAVSSPIDAHGAVEGVGAEPAGFERCRGCLPGSGRGG